MDYIDLEADSPLWSHSYHSYHYPSRIPLHNLTLANCTDGVPWIRDYIGSCVLDTRHYAAVIAGLISTLLSTVNGLPQIYVNCAKGIPDKALSIFLILQWLAGDSLNLTGGILTSQTPVQLIYACFMVSIDVIMLVQFTFFKIKHTIEDRRLERLRRCVSVQDSTGSLNSDEYTARSHNNGSVLFCCMALWTLTFVGLEGWSPYRYQTSSMTQHKTIGRHLLMAQPFFHGTRDKVGFALGCVSTMCYMGSRMPQIYKNWQRQSTEGVAFGLFFLMICSNICYGSSVLLHSTELMAVLHSLPWILGALGMVLFDCFIMFQFWTYRHNTITMPLPAMTDGSYDDSDRRRLLDDV